MVGACIAGVDSAMGIDPQICVLPSRKYACDVPMSDGSDGGSLATEAGCFGDTAGGKGVERMKKITIRKTGSIKLTSPAVCTECRC